MYKTCSLVLRLPDLFNTHTRVSLVSNITGVTFQVQRCPRVISETITLSSLVPRFPNLVLKRLGSLETRLDKVLLVVHSHHLWIPLDPETSLT